MRSQPTIDVLREHNFLRGDAQVDLTAMAEALAVVLAQDPVTTEAEIQTKALLVSELRYRLFGSQLPDGVEPELDAILGQLTSTGPDGKTQRALANGHVLCSARVTRKLNGADGAEVTVRRQGRFVTSEDDLIVAHSWAPQQARVVQAMRGLAKRQALAVERRPSLAARRAPVISDTYQQLQIEMTPAT